MTESPFPDDNLALAVLQSLIWERLVPEPDWTALAAANPYDRDLYWDDIFDDEDDEFDSEDEREEWFQEACGQRFQNNGVRYDLARHLARHDGNVPRLTRLFWDHGRAPADVVHACWPGWDGECDTFDIGSLAGVERCAALEVVQIGSLAAVDLRPLTRLPRLREIAIEHVRHAPDWRPLLEIPTLTRVVAPLDPTVGAELAGRGVAVR